MDRATCFLGGAAIGAAAMYYLDPERGRARRATCESRWAGRANMTKDYLGKAGRDLSHRAQGLAAETTNLATGKIRERTPAEGGHQAPSIDLLQGNLAPGTRLVLGTAGAGLVALGLTKEAPQACLLGSIGLAMMWPAVSGAGAARSFGLKAGRGIGVQKAVSIDGPVERVFPFFTRYDNWPRFMAHLKEVKGLGNSRSHWVAAGPVGIPASWDARITQFETNRLIVWESEPNSMIANAGSLRFEPAGSGTRVTIRMWYRPPGGVLGHFAASLFGADPRSEMDDDLIRMKGLIEQGSTHAPGKGQVARQDVLTGTAPEPAPAM
jgi:uncharacterized membrane protein